MRDDEVLNRKDKATATTAATMSETKKNVTSRWNMWDPLRGSRVRVQGRLAPLHLVAMLVGDRDGFAFVHAFIDKRRSLVGGLLEPAAPFSFLLCLVAKLLAGLATGITETETKRPAQPRR